MMQNPRFPTFAVIVCLLATAIGSRSLPAAELSESEVADLFSQGKELFRQANEISVTDPEAANALYQKSALRLERITREGGVENGKLYYNIGNAYFRMGDVGRAILNYRRAEQFIPQDENLQQNLQFARQRRTDKVEEQQQKAVLKTLFFWHYDLSIGARATLFVIAFLTIWIAAGLRLFRPRSSLRWTIVIASAISLMFLGSLIAETIALKKSRPGVVVADEVIARKGDSVTYEPSFQEPLHAGTEIDLLEERADWLHVELADKRQCWLPASAVELVW